MTICRHCKSNVDNKPCDCDSDETFEVPDYQFLSKEHALVFDKMATSFKALIHAQNKILRDLSVTPTNLKRF